MFLPLLDHSYQMYVPIVWYITITWFLLSQKQKWKPWPHACPLPVTAPLLFPNSLIPLLPTTLLNNVSPLCYPFTKRVLAYQDLPWPHIATANGIFSILILPKLAAALNTTLLLGYFSYLTPKTLSFLGSSPTFLATAIQSFLVPSVCL